MKHNVSNAPNVDTCRQLKKAVKQPRLRREGNLRPCLKRGHCLLPVPTFLQPSCNPRDNVALDRVDNRAEQTLVDNWTTYHYSSLMIGAPQGGANAIRRWFLVVSAYSILGHCPKIRKTIYIRSLPISTMPTTTGPMFQCGPNNIKCRNQITT